MKYRLGSSYWRRGESVLSPSSGTGSQVRGSIRAFCRFILLYSELTECITRHVIMRS